jgi:hypothetical protein
MNFFPLLKKFTHKPFVKFIYYEMAIKTEGAETAIILNDTFSIYKFQPSLGNGRASGMEKVP